VRIGFIVFDQLTQLDLTGPAQVLSRLVGAELSYVGVSLDPVATDCGFAIVPTVTRERCEPLDLVCVPGGYGVAAVMADAGWIEFVERQARGARYVTSVCTGAFILGAAGLLEGRRATTHWAYHDLLALFGAEPVQARTVIDDRLVTGGGVTAGIDFALTLVAQIEGETAARTLQIALEYDPAPPVAGGSPASAPKQAEQLKAGPFAERRAVMASASQAALDRRSAK
jgi:cyclohexyl-isocyanide hydratase